MSDGSDSTPPSPKLASAHEETLGEIKAILETRPSFTSGTMPLTPAESTLFYAQGPDAWWVHLNLSILFIPGHSKPMLCTYTGISILPTPQTTNSRIFLKSVPPRHSDATMKMCWTRRTGKPESSIAVISLAIMIQSSPGSFEWRVEIFLLQRMDYGL